jgi:RNA polymerase sigma factor (sigma-70 family)
VSASPEGAASPAQTLEQTFRTERRRMLRYFAWRVGHDTAPDLLQEVFMRAAGSPNAAHIENPTHYVWRIARNLLTDRARQRRRHPPIFVPFDEQRDPPAAPEQTLQIEADDLLRLYAQTVDRLPEKTRRVFLMSRVEHRTYREISEEVGVQIETVHYHMARALKALRESLASG